MRKKVLITAGSTIVPIDQVRSISNIFKGQTGTSIALEFAARGEKVTLITSADNLMVKEIMALGLRVIKYKTYDELITIMKKEIKTGHYDIVIHSSAVSDYQVKEVCTMNTDKKLKAVANDKKISSSHSDLYLHLTQTQKIIDLIRDPWGFNGYLVKFKLQVGLSDQELLAIADKSRLASQADMIVANCLEWSKQRAYIMTDKAITNIPRYLLPRTMYEQIIKQ